MRSSITLIFILLFFLSCKKIQTGNTKAKNNPDIREIVVLKTEQDSEKKVEDVITQEIPNCDLSTLVQINSLLEKGAELDDLNFTVFFSNMNPECSNNVEYSEFNNELIFKTLESNPRKFVAFLSKVSQKKGILEFVLTQLKNPVHDQIELNAIYEHLGKTETENPKMKELVFESIKKALEKNN